MFFTACFTIYAAMFIVATYLVYKRPSKQEIFVSCFVTDFGAFESSGYYVNLNGLYYVIRSKNHKLFQLLKKESYYTFQVRVYPEHNIREIIDVIPESQVYVTRNDYNQLLCIVGIVANVSAFVCSLIYWFIRTH